MSDRMKTKMKTICTFTLDGTSEELTTKDMAWIFDNVEYEEIIEVVE